MSFEKMIWPITEHLVAHNFEISERGQDFIRYTSKNVMIWLAYSDMERTFFICVGRDPESLDQLTPKAVQAVFDEDRYKFQSTLTIPDLISFLKDNGKPIVEGNIQSLKN